MERVIDIGIQIITRNGSGPFEGCGLENWRFLRRVNGKYDPESLSQEGCVGVFRLGLENGDA